MPVTHVLSDEYMPRTYQDVLEAIERRRSFPLTGVASKVLSFMLESGAGCDGLVTGERFEIRFGGRRMRRPRFYNLSVASAAVSQLLAWGQMNGGTRLRFAIGPEVVERSARLPLLWSFDRRLVWIDPASAGLSIAIRDGSDGSVLTEEPEKLRDVALAAVEDPAACPRCEDAPSLRSLSGDILTCGTCGVYFDVPSQKWLKTPR